MILVGAGLASSCGKQLPPMAEVSGKVTIDGQPVTGGQVTFIPDVPNPNDEGAKGQAVAPSAGMSAGQIDSSGQYKIYTAGKAGAPLGKYKVTVTPSMVPTGDASKAPQTAYNAIFSDANKTPLRKEVVASPSAGAYDLKLTK
jgi:hypothetical protein